MKSLVFGALLLSTSAVYAQSSIVAKEVLSCQGEGKTAFYFASLFEKDGKYYFTSNLNGKPQLLPVRRVDMSHFATISDGAVFILEHIKGDLFQVQILTENQSVERIVDFNCTLPNSTTIQVCESFEDFEGCKETPPAGPDGPIDDGEGEEPIPQDPIDNGL
ncbi:MAG TPA: hypothetical protein DCL41_02940 [Bdellovibrionales bacterium]|nr:hypothetical protein [Pseudobdellovibrionaceae bacterium]HAG90797.1 hypothetical protein [Bdellovibrionales bacterium]|tara:strand:- start:1145 stop:1630 length:486 start_codon:yes stop_codon:yes gene_type:complete